MQHLNTNSKRGHIRESALSGRVTTLLKVFGDGKPHKAASLAQHIGVNSRTIRRTLHFMRDEMGIPLMAGREGFQVSNTDIIHQALSAAESNVLLTPNSSNRFWSRAAEPLHV